MTNSIKLSKADKSIKAIVTACYPEYKGRKIVAEAATEYMMSNYWTEGSRNYVMAYHLESGKAMAPSAACGIPYNAEANARFAIPAGVLLVEHSFCCGKDCGIRILANPANMPRLLPAPSAE